MLPKFLREVWCLFQEIKKKKKKKKEEKKSPDVKSGLIK